VKAALAAMFVASVLLTGAAHAQSLGVRGTVVSVRARSDAFAAGRPSSGTALGFEGAGGVGMVALSLRYFQGTLSEDSTGLQRDLVEGDAFLGIRPVRWASAAIGPHVRSFPEAGGTQRWWLWELHVRGSTDFISRTLDAYVEGWVVLGANVDVAEPFDSGRGLESGLELAVGRIPVSVRLRYRVERLALGGGTRRETTEHIALALGIGRR
jgi:hypothetical protein